MARDEVGDQVLLPSRRASDACHEPLRERPRTCACAGFFIRFEDFVADVPRARPSGDLPTWCAARVRPGNARRCTCEVHANAAKRCARASLAFDLPRGVACSSRSWGLVTRVEQFDRSVGWMHERRRQILASTFGSCCSASRYMLAVGPPRSLTVPFQSSCVRGHRRRARRKHRTSGCGSGWRAPGAMVIEQNVHPPKQPRMIVTESRIMSNAGIFAPPYMGCGRRW